MLGKLVVFVFAAKRSSTMNSSVCVANDLSLLTYPQMKLDARAGELDSKHSAASSLAAALEQERSSVTELAKANADKVGLLVYNSLSTCRLHRMHLLCYCIVEALPWTAFIMIARCLERMYSCMILCTQAKLLMAQEKQIADNFNLIDQRYVEQGAKDSELAKRAEEVRRAESLFTCTNARVPFHLLINLFRA
jgi:hypothetical protein